MACRRTAVQPDAGNRARRHRRAAAAWPSARRFCGDRCRRAGRDADAPWPTGAAKPGACPMCCAPAAWSTNATCWRSMPATGASGLVDLDSRPARSAPDRRRRRRRTACATGWCPGAGSAMSPSSPSPGPKSFAACARCWRRALARSALALAPPRAIVAAIHARRGDAAGPRGRKPGRPPPKAAATGRACTARRAMAGLVLLLAPSWRCAPVASGACVLWPSRSSRWPASSALKIAATVAALRAPAARAAGPPTDAIQPDRLDHRGALPRRRHRPAPGPAPGAAGLPERPAGRHPCGRGRGSADPRRAGRGRTAALDAGRHRARGPGEDQAPRAEPCA